MASIFSIQNTKRLLSALGIVLLGLVALGCCIAIISIAQWQRRVPTAETLAGLSRSQIPLVKLLYIDTDEGGISLWISTRLEFGVPSGPAAYAFDASGNILDWGAETSEGRSIDYYYDRRAEGRAIDIRDAIIRIEKDRALQKRLSEQQDR